MYGMYGLAYLYILRGINTKNNISRSYYLKTTKSQNYMTIPIEIIDFAVSVFCKTMYVCMYLLAYLYILWGINEKIFTFPSVVT